LTLSIEDRKKYLSVAKEAAIAAGEYLKQASGSRIKIIDEPDRDVKLEADIESEKIILNILQGKSSFPILTEEQGFVNISNATEEEKYKWIVDPLDGSMNFSRGVDLCCVSIALWKNNNPILGVIYDFNHKELFTGLINKGAWLNDNPIQKNNVLKKSDAVFATGFPVNMDFSPKSLSNIAQSFGKYKKIRMIGSAALSLAYVACGRFDIYHEKNINIWDVAAGLALVKAAGGSIEYLGFPESNIAIVTATRLH